MQPSRLRLVSPTVMLFVSCFLCESKHLCTQIAFGSARWTPEEVRACLAGAEPCVFGELVIRFVVVLGLAHDEELLVDLSFATITV